MSNAELLEQEVSSIEIDINNLLDDSIVGYFI